MERKPTGKLFYGLDISQHTESEMEAVLVLLKEFHTLEIFGPIRPFTFGKLTAEKVLAYDASLNGIAYKVSNLIKACQYPPSNYHQYASRMQVTPKNGETYIAQVLSNTIDMVIEKVERYYINVLKPRGVLELYIGQIISIMQEEWELLDDCTILAKQLTEDIWNDFVGKAKEIGRLQV